MVTGKWQRIRRKDFDMFSILTDWMFIPLILFIVVAILVMALPMSRFAQYRAIPIMTENEKEFFFRIQKALPDHYVFPQVAMSAIIEPKTSRKSKQWHSAFNKIARKRVDYCIYDKDLKLITLIELDDRMHNRRQDAERDLNTGDAGIPTLRFESRKKPDETEIRKAVLTARAPKRPSGKEIKLPSPSVLADAESKPQSRT